jgi:hypothetical protein
MRKDFLVRAIRNGIGHDGRALAGMPWFTFAELADEDLASVIVYLHSLPPVKLSLPGRLLTAEREKRLQDEERLMETISVVQPDTSSIVSKEDIL